MTDGGGGKRFQLVQIKRLQMLGLYLLQGQIQAFKIGNKFLFDGALITAERGRRNGWFCVIKPQTHICGEGHRAIQGIKCAVLLRGNEGAAILLQKCFRTALIAFDGKLGGKPLLFSLTFTGFVGDDAIKITFFLG